MKETWNAVQIALAVIGGAISQFLGGLDGLVYALFIFVIVDYVTGFMRSAVEKKLSSAVGFRGIFRKVVIFLLVGIGHLIDGNMLGGGQVVRSIVIVFYLSNEGLSVLENAAALGLPFPEKLREVLSQLHNREDKK